MTTEQTTATANKPAPPKTWLRVVGYIGLAGLVLIIGLAAAAHQAFSANVYTLPSDLFPRSAVGSVIGIGGTVGAIGGMIFSLYIGQILARIGSYTPIFIVAGCSYFIALAAIHLLSPKLARTEGA